MTVREAFVVVDLGFGDAGKGSVVDGLVRARGVRAVVRWNGGAQAGHNVVTPDGRHHTFAQLGAGKFVPGVRTHLARDVVIHPTALLVEARALAAKGVTDALDRLTIDEDARVILPWHQAAGRLRELARGAAAHGTCGVGVGEAVRDALSSSAEALRARDLRGEPAALAAKLERARERLACEIAAVATGLRDHPLAARELALFEDRSASVRWIDAIAELRARPGLVASEALSSILRAPASVAFEGAQGVLLDENHGFHPFTTWSTTTFAPALALLRDNGWDAPVVRLGVVRVYAVRHGPGPFPTEAVELRTLLPEPHNPSDGWQGAFRVGWPDLVLLRYALAVSGGVDGLAVTHLDRLGAVGPWRFARSYNRGRIRELVPGRTGDLVRQEHLARELLTVEADLEELGHSSYTDWLAGALEVPVLLESWGPCSGEKRWRDRLGPRGLSRGRDPR